MCENNSFPAALGAYKGKRGRREESEKMAPPLSFSPGCVIGGASLPFPLFLMLNAVQK